MRHGFDHRLGERIAALRPLLGCWLFLTVMALAYVGTPGQPGLLPSDGAGLTAFRSWTPWLALCLMGAGASLAVYSRRPWLAVLPPLLLANTICFYSCRGLGALNAHDGATVAAILVLLGILPGALALRL